MTADAGDASALQRRRAVITGASMGIGRSIALRLAREGMSMLLPGRDMEALAEVCGEVEALGGKAYSMPADFTVRRSAQDIVDQAQQLMNGIDTLINSASATINRDFFSVTDDEWETGFEVKVLSPIRLCRAAWPALCESRGAIVNIGGVGCRTPRMANPMTSPTSAALMSVTKTLAERGIEDGVQVNIVHPGLIRTPRSDALIHDRDPGADIDQLMHRAARNFGATRPGLPQEVAELVWYIISPLGSFLHGAAIDLDGGATRGV